MPPKKEIDDGPLHEAAVAVELDRELAVEMAEWEVATTADGLCDGDCGPSQARADHK